MSEEWNPFPYYPGPALTPTAYPTHEDVLELSRRIVALQEELARERNESRQRNEAAYEHGLKSAAETHRQNRILAAAIAALINPYSTLNIEPKA